MSAISLETFKESAYHICCHSTPCKAASAALGVLLCGVSALLFFSNMHIVAYLTVGGGGLFIIGSVILTAIDCVKAKKSQDLVPHKKV